MMILGSDSRKPWSKWDRLIMVGYQILESERCPKCGLPRWVCSNEDGDIQVRILLETCEVQSRIDIINESNRNKTNYRPEPGQYMRPEPYTVSGKDLAEYREPYYKAQAERHEQIDASISRRGG